MASRARKKWEKPKQAAPIEPDRQEAPPSAPVLDAEPPPRAGFWQKHGRYLAALWVCSLIPYLNSFRAGLTFDNALAVKFDTRVHAATWANIKTIFTTDYWYNTASAGLYRPLTTLSYLFNYVVLGNGTNPAGYHVVNSALQAINVALVYLLGLAIFEEIAPAFALAAIWSVHPLLTESVTNIVGRSDQVAAAAVLGGLLLHIRAGAAAGRAKFTSLAALALLVGIGMFSKESSIVVLAAMALYDLAFPAPGGWRARRWGYAAVALPVVFYLAVRADVFAHINPGEFPAVDNPLVGADTWVARLTAVKVVGKYLWLFVWPARLSADYSYNQIPVAVDWQGVLSLVVCCALAVAAVLSLRRPRRIPDKAIFFFLALFFVTMAPTSNVFILIGTIMAERFLYLPSIGLVGCLVIGLFAAARRLAPAKAQAVATVAVAALVLAFGARTFARNFDWLSEHTLWAASLVSAPNSFKVHLSVAREQLDSAKPDLDRAVAEANRSLAIIADLPDDRSTCRPHQTAGEADRRKGDSLPDGPERQQWYRTALAVLLHGQKIDLAAKERITQANLAHGLKVMSVGWEPLYLELGRVYERLGEPDKAVEALRYGCSIKPHAEFFDEISRVYRLKGDNRQAAIALLEGLVNDPSVTAFATELVDLYAKSEPQSCALSRGPNGSSLQLGCPLVHDDLCNAARNVTFMDANSGRRDQAIGTARSAIQEMGCPANLFQ